MRRNLFLFSTAFLLFSVIILPGAFGLAMAQGAETDASLNNTGTGAPPSQSTRAPQASSQRRVGLESRPFETIAVGVKVSSLGIGIETATPLTHRSNLRVGFNMFSYDRTFDKDGITYGGTLKLQSAQALFDFFPLRSFRVSPGVLAYNGNELTATASVSGSKTFSLGSFTYFSDPTNPLTGTAKLSVNRVAPMLLVGFGNLVPRTRHFSVTADVGVAYHGAPKTSLNLSGNACDVGAVICRNVITDSSVQSAVQSEMNKLNDLAYPYKLWPIVSVGFGYKF
jgi:hypothetical protein